MRFTCSLLFRNALRYWTWCARGRKVVEDFREARGARELPELHTVPSLLTFPARPIQGGRLELTPPKRSLWFAEPKLNGWRALIHTPTGTMWIGTARCSPSRTVSGPRWRPLAALASRGLVWADCEALERRHNLGRSTLVVLDVVPESGTPTYEKRRAILESLLCCDPAFDCDTSRQVPCGGVVLTAARRADSNPDALAFYQRLRVANRTLGCVFFEGVVMRRADSPYPVQLHSAKDGFRGWLKHRFFT